jgi:hypothetical protein
VKGLLLDLHVGYSWVVEPKIRDFVEIFKKENKVIVRGFRSKDCKRVLMSRHPFDNLTCSSCEILQEINFCHWVILEEVNLEKMGTKNIGRGKRLVCLKNEKLT